MRHPLLVLALSALAVPALAASGSWRQDARPAVWALGLRVPFTFAVQPGTGRIFINDVNGHSPVDSSIPELEEINEGVAGANYGWAYEGDASADPSYTRPVYSYAHGDGPAAGCAITGGAFYNPRTQQYPAGYLGDYFFADYCSNTIWSFRHSGGVVSELTNRTAELVPDFGSIADIVSFGEDAFGELYILDHAGEIFKIMPDVAPVDCNSNGQGDACDILSGASTDLDMSGVPDECEIPPPPTPLRRPTPPLPTPPPRMPAPRRTKANSKPSANSAPSATKLASASSRLSCVVNDHFLSPRIFLCGLSVF